MKSALAGAHRRDQGYARGKSKQEAAHGGAFRMQFGGCSRLRLAANSGGIALRKKHRVRCRIGKIPDKGTQRIKRGQGRYLSPLQAPRHCRAALCPRAIADVGF
jgi:hypothetical protein